MGHAKWEVTLHPSQQNNLVATPQQDSLAPGLGRGPLGRALPITVPGYKNRNSVSVDDDSVNYEVQGKGMKGGKILSYFSFQYFQIF